MPTRKGLSLAREDFVYIADQLSGAQQRRLLALSRSDKSLPWVRTDEALKERLLVQRYTDPFDKAFAQITSRGTAVARFL